MVTEWVFTTEDDAIDAFMEVMGNETEVKFREGQIIRIAVEQGFKEKRLTRKIAAKTGKSKKTIERRLNVAQTFQNYDPTKDWYLYYIASTYVDYSLGVDKQVQERQKIKAQDYIETALTQNLTAPQLNKIIKADKTAEGRLKAPQQTETITVPAEIQDAGESEGGEVAYLTLTLATEDIRKLVGAEEVEIRWKRPKERKESEGKEDDYSGETSI